jgi:E3 ubiquitin-protein ligase BRE1
MFNMAAYVTPDTQPDLQKSLKENVDATRQLVTKFVQLSGPNNFPPSRVEMYAKAQEAQTQVRWPSHTVHTISHNFFKHQCTALRSKLDVMYAELHDIAAERDTLRTALQSAETRADRLQSKTVQAMQAKIVLEKQDVKQEESDESHRVLPSPPEVSGPANWWEFILKSCLPPLTSSFRRKPRISQISKNWKLCKIDFKSSTHTLTTSNGKMRIFVNRRSPSP